MGQNPRVRRSLRLLALCALFAGCRPPAQTPFGGGGGGCGGAGFTDPLAKVVADAQLDDVTMWQAGVALGHLEGDGKLIVHDDDGNEQSFDARLDGTAAGLMLDASVDSTFGVPYTFTLPTGPATTIRQVLGPYSGAHVGVDVIAGVQWVDLQNAAKVRFNITSMSFGLGINPAAYESIDIELWDDPSNNSGGCFAGNDGFCDATCASDPDC